MENNGAYIEGPILTVPCWIALFGSSRGAGAGTGTGGGTWRRFFGRFLVTPPVLGVTPSLLLDERSAQEIFNTPSKYSDGPIILILS